MNEKKSLITSLIARIKRFERRGIIPSIFWALIISLFVRSLVFEPYKVISGSMIPSLLVGDYLIINKSSYGYSRYSFPFSLPIIPKRIVFNHPNRGDIIVFKPTYDTSTNYIKRVIGLPGDRIQMRNSILYINGVAVPRVEKGRFFDTYNLTENTVYEETLPNGVKYLVLDTDVNARSDFPNTTPEYVVPEGHYFFIGDNRNSSLDSRFLDDMGPVPEEHLIGRASYLIGGNDFSFTDFLSKLKTGRVFSAYKYEN